MIRGNDFILNPDKLQEEFQLVEVSDWVDFSTKEKLGFYYTVLLPKLKFEKVKVGIKANTAIVTNEELEQNFDNRTKFVTLTFKENIQEILITNREFKYFIQRLNYYLYHTKTQLLKYLATWEKQKRGAIHYHVIFFDFPYIAKEKLQDLWSHGFIKINRIDVDSKENRGRYLSKYFGKDLDLKEHKKKAFFKSQNLKVPHETKVMLTEDILHDLQKENIVFQKEYTRQIYDTNAFLSTGSCLKDSSVIYIKIKKENPCVKGESYG